MRSGVGSRWSGRLTAAVRLAAALALLLAIGSDLAADSRCHAGPAAPAPAGAAALQAPSQEACGAACVPDCYCCSTPSVGLATALLEPTGPARPLVAVAEDDCPAGVRPLPYHPPLVLS
jgi:hypothetical protein